jgi:hypothetical protein
MSTRETQQRNWVNSFHTVEATDELSEVSSDSARTLQGKSLMIVKYIQ